MKRIKALLFSVVFLVISSSAFAATTYNVDVVILGAGAGGMTAGLSAVENGLNTLILEKMPAIGGSGNYMEGTFAVGSSMQIKDFVGVNPERQFKTIMDFHHWRLDPEVLNNWLKGTASTIDWLIEHGINFEGVHTAFVDGNRTWHMFEGGHGSSLIKHFNEVYREKGGKLLTETPAKSLIMKNGAVVGVMAEDADGEQITVNAKAVIVATGGFPCNTEMIKQYLPVPVYRYAGAAGRDGDGIKMMQAAGANLVNMGVVMQAGLMLKGVHTDDQFGQDGHAKYVRALGTMNQPYLLVSPKGDRMVDETESLEYKSNAFERVGGEGFIVFDTDTRKELENGIINGYFGMVPRMTKFDNFDQVINAGIKEGWAFKANTIEELAKITKMDPKTLKATTDRMNKMYENKYDDQMYKDPRWLRPVAKGPFYAISGVLSMYSTTGGSQVNSNYQSINTKGEIIPGLYAIGQDAGGLYSDSYDMHIAEGTASSWAINGGRFSAAHVAQTLGKKK